jgi:uncharacterized protein YxjI
MVQHALRHLATSAPRFLVRQKREMGEVLLGFETRNRYEIHAGQDGVVARAAEEGGGLGSFLLRSLLRRCRKATIHILDLEGKPIGRAEKPFRWYFHRLEVFDGTERIGALQRKWSLLHRIFVVEDAQGREVLTLKSPLFRIWTFQLLFGDQEVGRISKRWGGVLREAFTDADTFGVEFQDSSLSAEVRALLLAGTFLVDFTCFET